jgi:SAM-dependent methyltransferase
MNLPPFTVEETQRFYSIPHTYQGDLIAKVIARMSKPFIESPILDMGAGSGALLHELGEGVGIDLYPQSNRVGFGDCRRTVYADRSLKTVFATDVLEHISIADVIESLNEAHRILEPGGHLIINTRNSEDLSKGLLCCPSCARVFHRAGHCESFTVYKIACLLTATDFDIVKLRIGNWGFVADKGYCI